VRAPWLLAALALGLTACAPSPEAPDLRPTAIEAAPPPPVGQLEQPPSLADADLEGRWRILSLNGQPPQGSGERIPYLLFSPGAYGGSTGCNSFGGLGVLDGDRFYASPAGQTAIGCGALTAQEDAIIGLVTSSPRVSIAADGTLTLAGGGRTMALRRDPAGAAGPPATAVPALLAGTIWTIAGVDGQWLQDQRRTLRFEADRWSLSGACGTSGGIWRQSGDRIDGRPDPIVTRACTADAAALDDRLKALLAARPRFATGPNGEILIGGGGHWATGERPRSPLADESPLLAGRWRIIAIDGAPPAGEARISFGPTGYSGSASCNAMQGFYLAHARRLFSPPPMRTEMGCGPPLAAQEARVAALLAGMPRIALAGDDEIALVDRAGGLRLRREAAGALWAPAGSHWTGAPLRAELTMLDGVPLQEHYSHPVTRLGLTARRFDVATGCGRLGGVWRPNEGAFDFFTDAGPEPAGACAGVLARRLPAFMRLFNGRARLLVGASGELLIAGEEHMLAGRVLPPEARRRR
jgi:heat shock protein HslJ